MTELKECKILEWWDADGNRLSCEITHEDNPSELVFDFHKSFRKDGTSKSIRQRIPTGLIARWDLVLLNQFGINSE